MNQIKYKIPVLFLLVLQFSSINARDETDTIRINSLKDLFTRVVKNNPGQEVYRLQIKQASYNYKESRSYLYPAVSGNFSGQKNLSLAVTPVPGELVQQPGTTFYAQFGKKYAYNAGINIGQNLFDWPLKLQASIAKSNILLLQSQQDAYIQTVKNQAGNYFYSALIAKTSLGLSQTDLLYADSLVVLAKQRLDEGTSDALSLNQAYINYNNVQQNISQSSQLYDQGIENLKIILGVNPYSALILNGVLNPDSLITVSGVIVGADKNLNVYIRQEMIADLQRKQQKAVAYPKLSLSGYFGDQQYGNDFGLSFEKNSWSPYRYIGFNLSVPMFTGTANHFKNKSAEAQKQIASQQYYNAVKQSQINDELLLNTYRNYRDIMKSSLHNFQLYGHNLQLNQQKYREGISNMDVYFKAFEDYLRAENTYLNNLSQLLSTLGIILSRE